MTVTDDQHDEVDVAVVDELTAMYERLGELTAESVVAEASRASSPLHRYFEWDDTVAAREYRRVQARALIRRVTVVVDDRRLRAFPFIPSERSFAPIRAAMANSDWMEEVIADFLRQAQVFEARWKNHKYVADHYLRWLDSQKAS
jgi:hypothetical protein